MDLLQVISLYTLPIFINSLENLLCIYTYIYLSKYLYVYIYIYYMGNFLKPKLAPTLSRSHKGTRTPMDFQARQLRKTYLCICEKHAPSSCPWCIEKPLASQRALASNGGILWRDGDITGFITSSTIGLWHWIAILLLGCWIIGTINLMNGIVMIYDQ